MEARCGVEQARLRRAETRELSTEKSGNPRAGGENTRAKLTAGS